MMWQSGSPGQVVWLRRGSGDLGTADGKPIRLDSDAFQDESTRCLNWLWRGLVVADRPRNWLIGAFD